MSALRVALALSVCCLLPSAYRTGAATNSVTHYDRTIGKEPVYQAKPQYCLLTLGDRGEVKVWMVEDGKRLFVDKNANGDLTDDGPPLEPSKLRNLSGKQWDFEYLLDAITPAHGPQHTNFVLRRWNYNDPADCYGLSLSVNGQMPMYAGWFGTFWSSKQEDAPVIHLGGPFTPKLLRRKEFTLGESGQRLSLGFFNPGSGPGAESRLSIDALPGTVVPVLNIEWPTAAGKPPLRKSYNLTQRCCYWEFYTTQFELPSGVVAGNAKLSVELLNLTPTIKLTTTELVVPVLAKPR